jgi:hypothetical protein
MDHEGRYLEQYCQNCHDETDQRVTDEFTTAACLWCGTSNGIETEDDRIGALIQRIREEDAAALGRLREAVVPLV